MTAMGRAVLLAFSLLLFCGLADGLFCKVCKFKVGALCFHPSDPCTAKTNEFCETTKAYIGKVPLFSKYGCSTDLENCNKTELKDRVFDVSYNRTCCTTDLCNAASSTWVAGLPLLLGLEVLLGWWLLK